MAEELHLLPRELEDKLLLSDIVNWLAYRKHQQENDKEAEASASGKLILRARNV